MSSSPEPLYAPGRPALLIGTRKGAWSLRPSGAGGFELFGPVHFGSPVNDLRQDPRAPERVVLAVNGGHLGPTVFRSDDAGRSFAEASAPPAFEAAPEGAEPLADGTSRGLSVSKTFWVEPGHTSRPGHWYVGTCPEGLFESDDEGATWSGVAGFNLNPRFAEWACGADPVPDGPFLHSIQVDPRDADHVYLSMSIGGTFESTDGGASWRPLNANVDVTFGPELHPEFGQDPHQMIIHPADPDVLYQQNHCGIYRLDRRTGDTWTRIGRNMPDEIGDIGFGIAGHPCDANTVWVFPMDGTKLWPRTSPSGKPAMYRTRDGGESWQRLDAGLPAEQAWFTVKRQCLTLIDVGDDEPAVVFGTTSGEVWLGRNGGERFEQLCAHMPEILSVRTTA